MDMFGWIDFLNPPKRHVPPSGGLFSPCDMNLSASQHAQTPPERKRLFVNVPFQNPVTPENKKGGSLTPNSKGSLMMARLESTCLMQGIRAPSCDPPRKPETVKSPSFQA